MTNDAYLKLCQTQYANLIHLANLWFDFAFWAALGLIVLTACEKISAEIRAWRNPATSVEAGGAGGSGIMDSLKGLVAALAQAPPWFAIFLAGAALLWSTTAFTPKSCANPPSLFAAPGDNATNSANTASNHENAHDKGDKT